MNVGQGSAASVLDIAVAVDKTRRFRDISAQGVVVMRIVFASIGLVVSLVYFYANWNQLPQASFQSYGVFAVLYALCVVNLLVNVAHLRTMTRFYKLYNVATFLFELLLSLSIMFAVLPFIVFSIFFNPIKFLSNVSSFIVALSNLFVAYHFYKIIDQEPIGQLQKGFVQKSEARILGMQVIEE